VTETFLGPGGCGRRSWVNHTKVRCKQPGTSCNADLLCVRYNSASYPRMDGKWPLAYRSGMRSEGTVWMTGVMVCLLAAPQLDNTVHAMPHR